MIVDRHFKMQSHQIGQVGLPIKNYFDEQFRKTPTIHRHYSEDDFKKNVYVQKIPC